MTTLTELRKLALAATPGPMLDWTHPDPTGWSTNKALLSRLSTDYILALLDVIEAADAMRAEKMFGTSIEPVTSYDAARARLEEMK